MDDLGVPLILGNLYIDLDWKIPFCMIWGYPHFRGNHQIEVLMGKNGQLQKGPFMKCVISRGYAVNLAIDPHRDGSKTHDAFSQQLLCSSFTTEHPKPCNASSFVA